MHSVFQPCTALRRHTHTHRPAALPKRLSWLLRGSDPRLFQAKGETPACPRTLAMACCKRHQIEKSEWLNSVPCTGRNLLGQVGGDLLLGRRIVRHSMTVAWSRNSTQVLSAIVQLIFQDLKRMLAISLPQWTIRTNVIDRVVGTRFYDGDHFLRVD